MNDTMTTTEDIVKAAASVARDAAEGRLSPGTVEAQLETELRALVGTVVGPDDPLFALQVEIARGVLAVGGVPTDELAEWLAVARHRTGEALSAPEPLDPAETPLLAESAVSVALTPESEAAAVIAEVVAVPVTEPAPVVTPLRRVDGYDALAGWQPGGTRRR